MALIGSAPIQAIVQKPTAPPEFVIPAPLKSNGVPLNLAELSSMALNGAAATFSQLFKANISNIRVVQGVTGGFHTDSIINQGIEQNVNNGVKQISQDAVPNEIGGFVQNPNSPFWNGRMSSIFGGLPVMTSLTLGKLPSNQNQNTNPQQQLNSAQSVTYTSLGGQQITIPVITFEMVLIKMKQGKNIEKTDITGRETGSVKEYISAKDWSGTFEVVITAAQNISSVNASGQPMQNYWNESKYPEENMEVFDILRNAPIAIPVICPYMNKRGINFIVFDDGIDISQITGEYEAQKITIPWVSDNPLILQVVQ